MVVETTFRVSTGVGDSQLTVALESHGLVRQPRIAADLAHLGSYLAWALGSKMSAHAAGAPPVSAITTLE